MLLLGVTFAQIGVHSFGLTEKTIVVYPNADVYAFNDYSRPQLKFDISGIPPGSNIIFAKLWLYRFAADNWNGDVTIYRVDDQLWNENITASEFNTQTLTDGENNASKFMTHGWDNIDVLNQLKVDQAAGHAYMSLRLTWNGDDGKEQSAGIDDNRFLLIGSKINNLSIFFNSKEFDGNYPYLDVTYTLLYAVSASVSPSESSGSPGGLLNYTVVIKNIGAGQDNYALAVSDNSGWGPTLDNIVLGPIPVGENMATTLHVNIPNLPGTTDNITVTAISQADNTVRDNASCIAQALTTPPPQPPPPSPPAPKDNTPPSAPSLISPTNGASMTDNTPLFDWSDANDPSGVTYDLSIARDAGFVSTALLNNGITASTYTLISAEALGTGKYYWRVRAVDGAGNVGSWSENWSFNVSPIPPPPTKDNTPPSTPSLISPTNGASMTDNTPLFDWSDANDPSGVTYDLSIARDAGFVSTALLNNGITASTYTLISAEALGTGKYYWRVRAVDGANNVSSWSENWSFNVSPTPSPTGPAEILLISVISLLLVAIIAAIMLYLRKRHVVGRRRGVLQRKSSSK